jgi:hypothetical protein
LLGGSPSSLGPLFPAGRGAAREGENPGDGGA